MGTWPQDPSQLKVELQLSGTWTDITAGRWVRTGEGVTIVRGRRDEGSTAAESTCNLDLKNADGRFSPRNPIGPYYGSIGRNTPLRVSVPATRSYLNIRGTQYAYTSDKAALDITGDIDIRWWGWLATKRPTSSCYLVFKFFTGQHSYRMGIDAAGTLSLAWSTDGTTDLSASSTVAIPPPVSGDVALRATLDVNNGAGGRTITFYTSDSITGTWTQLGDAVVQSGTTSIYAGTSALYAYTATVDARVYGLEVRNGIGGTAVANPDWTTQADGTTSFADAAGNTWLLGTGTQIVGRNWRFHGEVSEWPQQWGHSGRDAHVPITASGIMRRLGTGSKPLKSAYYRGCTSTVAPVTALQAYWPMEDAAGSTTLASGLPGGSPMAITGVPTLASNSTSFPCSAPLPDMGTAAFSGTVRDYTSTGQIQVRALLAVPATGTTNGAILMSVRCGGTAARWELVYGTGGTLALNAYNTIGTSLLATGGSAFGLDGVPCRIDLELTQSGSNVTYTFSMLPVGSTTGVYVTGSLASQSVTKAQSVVLASGKNMSGVTMGQVTVQSAVTSVFDLSDHLDAYSGETAVNRLVRLCGEESIECVIIGNDGLSAPMGPQGQRTLLELLRECETTDGGVLCEPRELLGIAYRTAGSLASQGAGLTLDYAAAQISAMEPREDDQATANDLTVTRAGGSSYRHTVTSGPLSTQAPPSGVGVYDRQVTVNAAADSQLGDIASWLAHLGTVDEPRYPGIGVRLARANWVADTSATRAASGIDIGDRIDVTNPPAWLPPGDISQMAIGYRESLGERLWDITWVGQPASPWRIGVFDATAGTAQESRYSGEGTVLAEDLTTTETGVDVTAPAGVEWTHDDGDYDVVTGGEVMTVTGISGTAPNYTFTVTRSVNSVVKAHSSGAAIDLATPVYYGI